MISFTGPSPQLGEMLDKFSGLKKVGSARPLWSHLSLPSPWLGSQCSNWVPSAAPCTSEHVHKPNAIYNHGASSKPHDYRSANMNVSIITSDGLYYVKKVMLHKSLIADWHPKFQRRFKGLLKARQCWIFSIPY